MRKAARTLRLPKQARSEQSTSAVLDAAAALIALHGVAATSIAAVAHAAGSSVGAIYFRFGDKNRLVDAVLARVIGDIVGRIDALLADGAGGAIAASELLAGYVALTVDVFRRERGLMRAMFAQSLTDPAAFDPWRNLGIESRTRLAGALARCREMHDIDNWEFRVLGGLQAVYGTLLNATMNRAWPMALDDPRMQPELTRLLLRYIGMEGPGIHAGAPGVAR